MDEIDISPSTLLKQIEALTARAGRGPQTAEEYLTALQRERAEFQNFKRRTAEERMRDLGLAAEDLIRKVLVLADDFDRAIDARPPEIADHPWLEGISAIDRKLRQLLESEGVTAIDASAGRPFDPARARGDRQRPRPQPGRGRDRRGGPARLSPARPGHPPGPRGRRHLH